MHDLILFVIGLGLFLGAGTAIFFGVLSLVGQLRLWWLRRER